MKTSSATSMRSTGHERNEKLDLLDHEHEETGGGHTLSTSRRGTFTIMSRRNTSSTSRKRSGEEVDCGPDTKEEDA